MKFKKAVKMMAAFTAVAAGIGTAVYLIKDKLNQEDLAEDFDDDFDDDFEDFDEEQKNDNEDSRNYVNIHCPASEEEQTPEEASVSSEEPEDAEAASDDEGTSEDAVSEE